MSVPEATAWLDPISAESPCGQDVEYTALPPLDAMRVFGQKTGMATPPDWREVSERAVEGLRQSKDLRLLGYLGAAVVRADGLPAFAPLLTVAAEWLTQHWADVYPRVDDDALLRRNALNCLADPAAVVEPLRRAPLVKDRQHGTFSLRDVEIAGGQQVPGDGDTRVDPAQIAAAFGAMSLDDLRALQESAAGGLTALKRIEATMAAEGGTEMVPTFDALSGALSRIERLLRTQMAGRSDATVAEAMEAGTGEAAVTGAQAVGAIRTREDAMRALDAVAEFFRRNEPSSPVPLFVERAKRLVSKNFLEVLADVAPDALSQARAAGGITESE